MKKKQKLVDLQGVVTDFPNSKLQIFNFVQKTFFRTGYCYNVSIVQNMFQVTQFVGLPVEVCLHNQGSGGIYLKLYFRAVIVKSYRKQTFLPKRSHSTPKP